MSTPAPAPATTAGDEFPKWEKVMGERRSKMSIPNKIEMYGLWCVSTRGACTRPRPSRTRLLEYGKWAAWKKYEHLGQENARKRFVERARVIFSEAKL